MKNITLLYYRCAYARVLTSFTIQQFKVSAFISFTAEVSKNQY